VSTTLTALMIGTGVGLSVAAPIGPAAMLCIQRTLASGIMQGLATGFGVSTVHLVYCALTVTGGISLAQDWLQTAMVPFASGMILLWFAIRVFRRNAVLAVGSARPSTLMSSYCGAIGFGFLNPTTPVLFAAMAPMLIGPGPGNLAPLLITGVFMGSLAWWCVLSSGISLLRSRMTSRALGLMNKGAGMAMAGLAIIMLARAWNG
jgi:threonine/homoserine/homoserine lactone efflux protein